MPFNSYEFLFAFLPVTVTGFLVLVKLAKHDVALGWLITASLAFYAFASPKSLIVILPSLLLDYLAAVLLLRTPSGSRIRKLVFATGVTLNVLVLGYFKYRNFFLETANTVLSTQYLLAQAFLPLGLSFITFQKIAFLADVHSGQVKSVRLLDYLLFALFFPRAIAGPIVHYNEVVPQFSNPVSPARIACNLIVGGSLFSIGLVKKTIIADHMAQFVPRGFDQAAGLVADPVTLLTAWASVLAYTFQLYFDFSGYSDMALGIARLFGVKLPMNFNSPLKSRSMVEFWSRWHITLTRFLTWYIYIPLVRHLTRWRAATRRSVLRGANSRTAAILSLIGVPTLVTMTISGLWHGAGWHYVVWGILHGFYLSVNQTWRLLRPRFWSDQVSYDRVMRPLGFVLTFGCVVVALVFFRADSVTSAFSILGAMVGTNGIFTYTVQSLHGLGITTPVYFLWWTQPVAPLIWIVALFICTTFLPNSLQLLARYQPALDFPSERPAQSQETDDSASAAIGQSVPARSQPALEKAQSAWRKLRLLGHEGLSLTDDLSAVVIALLFFLGVIGLGQGDAFLYGQF